MTDALPPARYPLACGALGEYDAGRVWTIADALSAFCPGAELRTQHGDRRSILMLDRPARRWGRGPVRGLAWKEGNEHGGRVGSWRQAATRLSACGLVLDGDRRYLHTSVSGIAPIYFSFERGATYFASRIDPLVATSRGRLSVDWEAWAAIFVLSYPLGARTPFAEISRLEPFSTLEQSPAGRTRVSRERWPWADVEPDLDLTTGTEGFLEAMRRALERLPSEQVRCALSGGWDSRLLLSLLADLPDRRIEAVTANLDDGRDDDERMATPVASALGVPHRVLDSPSEAFWADMREHARRTDYQRVDRPRFVALARGLSGGPGVVTDGLGGDVLLQPGDRYIPKKAVTAPPGQSVRPIWLRVARLEPIAATFDERLARPLTALARRQFKRQAAELAGSPSEALLTVYRTRTLRGISLAPVAVVGADVRTVTPFLDPEVATALLRVKPEDKFGSRLYRAAFNALNPSIGALPSTNDQRPPARRAMPHRERSEESMAAYARLLRASPFAEDLAPAARRLLDAGAIADLFRTTNINMLRALAIFGLWLERYSDRLGAIDPADGLSLRRRPATRGRLRRFIARA